jgi:similar to stage IV sporulation protein
MILSLSRFIFGEVRYRITGPSHRSANLFLHSGIPCFKGCSADGRYEISIEKSDQRALERLLGGTDTPYEILYEKGLLPFLLGAVKRPGLVLGLLFALFLLFQSKNYVWDIRITGNEALSERQVEAILKEYGFYIGCRHTAIDLHRFCNDLPIGREDIAWISVNMMGSVAEVQIIENKAPPEKAPVKTGLVNLVAKSDGVIVRYELSAGRAMVSVGETVSRGQLLVAGFSEKEGALHPKVSAGRVFAKVWLTEETFISYATLEKIEKKQVPLEKKINFLGKEIIFFKNSRFSEGKYDILEDEYRPTVFGVALPLPITVKYALPYTEQEGRRPPEDARALGKKQLIEKIRGVSEELLLTEFSFEERDDGVRVTLKALCMADIAKPVKVTVEEDRSS